MLISFRTKIIKFIKKLSIFFILGYNIEQIVNRKSVLLVTTKDHIVSVKPSLTLHQPKPFDNTMILNEQFLIKKEQI